MKWFKKSDVCACNECGVLFKAREAEVDKLGSRYCSTHAQPYLDRYWAERRFYAACERHRAALELVINKLEAEAARHTHGTVYPQSANPYADMNAAANSGLSGIFGMSDNTSNP